MIAPTEIKEHYGHEIVVAQYSRDGIPENYAIECLDCDAVLMDADEKTEDQYCPVCGGVGCCLD